MVISGRFNQSPTEKKRYLIDWTLDLAAGETVTALNSTTVSSPSDPNNNGGCGVSGFAFAPGNLQAAFFVSFATPASADQQTYNITFLAQTSVGQILETVVQYIVKDKVDS